MPGSNGIKKFLFLFIAGLFFLVGLAGLLLPGLPGTPFFLLTSYFLVRSYPPLNERLLRSKLIGPILRDWQVRGGVQPRVKIRAVSVVVLVVGATLFFSTLVWPLKLAILALAVVGVIVVVRLPSVQ